MKENPDETHMNPLRRTEIIEEMHLLWKRGLHSSNAENEKTSPISSGGTAGGEGDPTR